MADQYGRQLLSDTGMPAIKPSYVIQGKVIIMAGPSDSGICTARIFGADHQTFVTIKVA